MILRSYVEASMHSPDRLPLGYFCTGKIMLKRSLLRCRVTVGFSYFEMERFCSGLRLCSTFLTALCRYASSALLSTLSSGICC